MDPRFKKKLRAVGHGLKPVVTVGKGGVSDAVLAEIKQALDDHQLIKIKVADRDLRHEVEIALADFEATDIVQVIGMTLLVYQKATGAPF